MPRPKKSGPFDYTHEREKVEIWLNLWESTNRLLSDTLLVADSGPDATKAIVRVKVTTAFDAVRRLVCEIAEMNSVSSQFIFEVRDERARVRNLVRRLLDPADLGPPPAAGAAPTIHQSTMTEAGQPLPAATEAGPSRLAPRAPEEEGRAAKRRRFSTDRPAVVKSAAANRAKVTSPMRKTEDTVEEDMAEEDEDITSQPEPPVKKKAASKNKPKIKEERKRTASRGVLVETSADDNWS